MKKKYDKPLSARQIAAVKDEEIDYSDIPELDNDFFENATLIMPPKKQQLTLRIDEDVLNWLKSQGRGYQTRINAILRAYYDAQHDSPKKNKWKE